MSIRMWKTRKVPGNPLLSMVIASYLLEDERRWASLSCLLWSLAAQTYQNWEAVIVHDGPLSSAEQRTRAGAVASIAPRKIRFLETSERKAKFGHPWRKWGVEQTRGAYIGMTNDDNYYCPTFCESMLSGLVTKKAQFAYCNMVHSHQQWRPFKTEPRKSKLDLGGWVASVDLVRGTPWADFGFAGDGVFIDALVVRAKGVVKIDPYLFVHN